jgi:RNA polymerase sigma factor (TIGR02999 family)
LHKIASNYFRRERRDHTLQPTALVHEAYLRLVGQQHNWENHLQFLGVAAIMMRRVLVDHARLHTTAKRGHEPVRVPLEDALMVSEQRADEMLMIDQALTRLAAMDPQDARLIELRFFGGLSIEDTAKLLQISPATAKRRWHTARAWLRTQVGSPDPA